MNEQHDFEHLVADQIAHAGVGTPPASAIEDTIARAGGTRRLPEWLALIKEPPMRTNEHLAVGSPTVRRMAILAATLVLAIALAAAGAGAKQLLAADSTIVVAQDGSGDYTTITQALEAAESGRDIDEILIRPGTYIEALFIDRDITLKGDGERDEIIITAPEGGPRSDTHFSWLGEKPYAIVLEATEGSIENLTFRGTDSRLFLDDGAPMIDGVMFDGVGEPAVPGTARAQAIIFTGRSKGTVRDSVFRGGGGINVFAAAAPVIERNQLDEGTVIYGDYADGTIIRENTFTGPGAFSIRFGEPAEVLVKSNEIRGREYGIDTVNGLGSATIEGNTISGATTAISADGSTGQVIDNAISDSVVGISWSGEGGVIADNTIRDGATGIIVGAGTVTVQGNTVEGAENTGMLVYATATAELSGNTLCGNTVDIEIVDGADVSDDGSNVACDDVTE
jgi:hypothetical protein